MTKEELEALVAKMVADAKATETVEKEVVVEDVKEKEKGMDMEAVMNGIAEGFAGIAEKLETKATVEVGLEGVEKDAKGGFKSITHFAVDVAKAMRSGYRSMSKELDAWDKHVKAAGTPSHNEGDPEAGGHLVPPEFRQDLLMAVEQKNDILPRVTKIPMQSNVVQIPYVNGFDESGGLVSGGVEWKWLDEQATKVATDIKFGKVSLQLKKVAGLAYASDELLEDSPMSLENILRNGFRDGLNFQMNKVLVRGSGVGQPLGILNAPCKAAVAKEVGQAADTILFENIIKMYSRASNPGESVWMANPDTLPQLATMSLAVGTGGVSVFMPANGAAGIPYNTLFGLPLIFNKHCSTVGDEGDICLVDWSQYLFGMKAGAIEGGKFDTSMHVAFINDQQCFRLVFRCDGQSWWPSALTPPNSTATHSPIITLAARA